MRNSGEWGNSSMAGMGSGRPPLVACCERLREAWTEVFILGRRVVVSAVFSPLADWLPRSRVAVVEVWLLPYAHLSARGPSQPRGDAGWFSEKVAPGESERNPCPNPSGLMSVW